MQSSRRKFLHKSALGLGALTMVPLMGACAKSSVKITILHTNDVHSHIDPFPSNHSRWANLGGFARRAKLIEQIRAEQKHVLLFDCGDIFQGTPYFNIYKGKLEIDLMNKMAYDAVALGNHEFDNGIDALAGNLKRAKFPIVCSNYDVKGTALDGITLPYQIFERGPVKVGVLGLGIELSGLVNPNAYKGTKYRDPIAVANRTAAMLKSENGCDVVVALSHLGYRYDDDKVSDVMVAQHSQNIDLILGGHTHTFLDEPARVKNKNDQEVIVNQAGWGGIYLGRIDIELRQDDKKSVALVNSNYHV
ncbi:MULTISPECIES: bifunctional metallophosphatase/5'-nucleotidase [unclassified Carboxylicivirga]|uniref:bifunctional metallophosphatase/5'-nucleotidase n=1 Tax=Carboxylicivirga TaxID=1628153 RepID=UPI003D32F050